MHLKVLIKRKEIIYPLSILLLITSIFFVYKYTNDIKILILQLSIMLLTPQFWFKAFKFIILKLLHTFFSDTFINTLYSMFERHIEKPFYHFNLKILKWYNNLNKFEKAILWIFLILLGFVLILLVFRTPLLIKLFWKRIVTFTASRGARFLLAPYIKPLVVIFSSLLIYRITKLYLLKLVIKPTKNKIIKIIRSRKK